jgi:hypothetical protein
MHAEVVARPELKEIARRFETARRALRERLGHLAAAEADQAAFLSLRVDCNRLVLQAAQVALTVSKGTGFVLPHPAQRWARQALFFLVWSCPRPAAEGMIAHLLPAVEV